MIYQAPGIALVRLFGFVYVVPLLPRLRPVEDALFCRYKTNMLYPNYIIFELLSFTSSRYEILIVFVTRHSFGFLFLSKLSHIKFSSCVCWISLNNLWVPNCDWNMLNTQKTVLFSFNCWAFAIFVRLKLVFWIYIK